MKGTTLKGLLILLSLGQCWVGSITLSSPQVISPNQSSRGLAQITSLLSSLINTPQYPGYPTMYTPVNYTPPLYSPPVQPMAPRLNVQGNALKQLVDQLQVQTAPQPERELISNHDEQERLENFLEQFLVITKRHSYKSYFSFKRFYKTYLEKAEEMLKINHQEFRYLLNLEKYIFLQNFKNGLLDYTVIRGQMTLLIQGEQSDILDKLSKNTTFILRTDYFQILHQKDPASRDGMRKKMTPHQEAIFSSKFAKIRHLMKMERVWHECLRNGKKDNISRIHRRELKKSIHKGQKQLKDVIQKAQKFIEKNKDMKKTKDTRVKMKVLYYLLDMIQDHKMGSFYTRLSSFYKDISVVSRKMWSPKKQALLDQKARKLHSILNPLSFLTSVYRIININKDILNETAPKVKHIKTLSSQIVEPFKDPRTKAVLKLYFDILLERINEIDFFLFRKPERFFSVTPHKVLHSVLSATSAKEFIQFNANLDLLFIQIAKIEFYLFSGRNVKIMNDVRPKYFRFFRTLIEPLVRKKSTYDLDELQEKDKEFFEDMENLKKFRETLKEHISEANSERIGDLEISKLKSDPKESLALTEEDVHKYLKSDEDIDDMDYASSRSNDFFYVDSKPTNRHDGSEGGSEVNESMIDQFDLYEKELRGVTNENTDPVSKSMDNSVIQREVSVANKSMVTKSMSTHSHTSEESLEKTSHQNSVVTTEVSTPVESTVVSQKTSVKTEKKSEHTQEASEKSQHKESNTTNSEEGDITKDAQNNVVLTDAVEEKSTDNDEDLTTKNRKMKDLEVVNVDEYTTSDGDESSVEELNVNTDSNADAHDIIEVQKEETKTNTSGGTPDIPVKVKKKTVVNQVWLNGGFKKKNSHFSVKDFENEEDDVESMIVSMPDLKKVKISRLLVLKAKIVSEVFMKFFGKNQDEQTVMMINSGQKLMRGGILKKSTSQKLNYLLLVVSEANQFRKMIAENEYFDQILDLWKVFMIEFACSCQLKLYIRLLKRVEMVEDLKYLHIWKNLTKFLSTHKDYDFIKCDGDILRVWMNSTLFVRKKRESAIIRDTFKKVFLKHKHQEKVKSIRRKKMLLKKVLNKIRSHSMNTPSIENFNKYLLYGPNTPGNKVTDKDPKTVKAVLNRIPKTNTLSKSGSSLETQSKVKLLSGLDPGNKETDSDPSPDDGPEEDPNDSMNYSKKFQTLLKKKTVMNMLMGHLKKIKLKSSEAVEPDIMRFTKSLVVGTLIDSKKGEPSLANLAKLSFKMTPKNLSYIEKLKTEYRNVDNIRISEKSDKIFNNLKKIFFKPIRGVPHLPPEKTIKKYKKRMRKRLRKRKAMFRIFKKCKWGQKDENGCCDSDGGSDDSVYNYRPNYEFKFDFEDDEQLAQFEEFLRSTESIDKLLSSNMIDMKKAKEELEKAKFSKTFHVTINGKKVKPEQLLTPKDNELSHLSDNNSQDSENPDHHKNKSPKMRIADSNPILTPVDNLLDDEDFEDDMKKIDEGYKNQPSIENAIEVKDVPVDENGNPIEINPDAELAKQKAADREEPVDDLQQFIDKITPVVDNEDENHHPSEINSEASSDSLDQDLSHIISQDITDKKNNLPLPGKQNGNNQPLTDVLDEGLETPEQINRMFKPSNRRRDDSNYSDFPHDESHDDSEHSSPHKFHDMLDASEHGHNSENSSAMSGMNSGDSEEDSNTSEEDPETKRDNYYASQLVHDVENNLNKKRPMKNYSFDGSRDWDTEQVHTNKIQDEGILGADINKYPDMSDAMKNRLNKEIEETGGYPDLLDRKDPKGYPTQGTPGKLLTGYAPFHLEDGHLIYAPLEGTRFLI